MAHGDRGRLIARLSARATTVPVAQSGTGGCANGFGVTQSMGAIGTNTDDVLAEAFNATLKRNVLQDWPVVASQLVYRRDVFRWRVGTTPNGAVIARRMISGSVGLAALAYCILITSPCPLSRVQAP